MLSGVFVLLKYNERNLETFQACLCYSFSHFLCMPFILLICIKLTMIQFNMMLLYNHK